MIIKGTKVLLNILVNKDGNPIDLTDIIDAKVRIQKPETNLTIELDISILDPKQGLAEAVITNVDELGIWKLWIVIPSIGLISSAKTFKVFAEGTIG